MNAYQRQLLDKLINELTDKPSPSLHTAQMLAAELKGAMQAQDAPTQPITPTPDADGWVENTGTMPECEISAIRFYHGGIEYVTDKKWSWDLTRNGLFTISHYLPA